MSQKLQIMRDVFIEELTARMAENTSIFFLSADFGSPKLDALKENYPDRFINVGIAEQNLINIATGLALEGFTVYAYAIAPFITMRCYEQIRVNLAILSQERKINVNLIGVGAGYSYDVSGPTHQALEDICIMRALPNIELFSPADGLCARAFVDYTINNKTPKYIRFDGKPMPDIYQNDQFDTAKGFHQFKQGSEVCFISTGYCTHRTLALAKKMNSSPGVIDFFMLKTFDQKALVQTLSKYKLVITMEEGFTGKGGLDTLILHLLHDAGAQTKVKTFGVADQYSFAIGGREMLHRVNQASEEQVIKTIEQLI